MKGLKATLTTGGTLVSALLSFLPLRCCVFPIAFSFLGFGTLTFAQELMSYRPYFIVMTFAFLGAGFYFAYRPQKETCADGDACAQPKNQKLPRIILWITTILAIALLAFPYLLPYLPV